LRTGTKHNLRAVSLNPISHTVLAVGNSGTIIEFSTEKSFRELHSPTGENLRAVSWNNEGDKALIVGNNGALLKYAEDRLDLVEDGRANLRAISWRGKTEAIVSSNCFAQEFIPSPNLFVLDTENDTLRPVGEGRIDLIGAKKGALRLSWGMMWFGTMGSLQGSMEKTCPPLNSRTNGSTRSQ
jgi:hypothetical protein